LLSDYPEFKKIIWKEQFQQELPLGEGDFGQLQEVFVNLGLNACQAMSAGGEITVETKHNESERFIDVLVRDTGQGIDETQLSKLFDPFFTTKEKGTGLGLAMCRKIIDAHKGSMEVESIVGKGTTFIVKIPVKVKAMP